MVNRQRVLEQVVEHTREGLWVIDTDAVTLDVNPAMCRILGRSAHQIIGRPIYDFVDDQNREIFRREIGARGAGADSVTYEIALQRPDGQNVPCINNATSVWDDEGTRVGSVGLWTDITTLKTSEAELRAMRGSLEQRVAERTAELARSESRLREAHRIARLGSWDADACGNLNWSAEVFDLFGADPSWFDSTTSSFYQLVHPDDRQRVRDMVENSWEHLERFQMVHRIVLPDGRIRTVRENAAVVRDQDGRAVRMSGTVQDITDQVEAEERLHQAQRLEAIGKLTGGVAHDFNNLLAVIMGAAEFLQMSPDHDSELVQTILRATERGAALTHRMLAYARQQPLHTTSVDLLELVEELTDMLDRTLGAAIAIRFAADAGLWPASADPGQVEGALLNLAINARDAMPAGGSLDISCRNTFLGAADLVDNPDAEPGDFVALAVRDTGTGMSADVLQRATEPFFTTKGCDGSGLGLSMVYGFARQSRGHLTIDTRPGSGTEVTLFLPRAAVAAPGRTALPPGQSRQGQGEAVLVLEDDPAVGRLTERLLLSLNYDPVVVPNAAAAQSQLDAGKRFDLILSDVVLPNGQSGPDFVLSIRDRHPDIKVIFMSGYPSGSADIAGLPEQEITLINKPFLRSEFGRTIRDVLNG